MQKNELYILFGIYNKKTTFVSNSKTTHNMDQLRQQALAVDIQKQIDLGFSAREIKENLMANGYSSEELGQVNALMQKNEQIEKQSKASPWTIIISVVFILRGIMYLSKGQTGLGVLMLGVGFIGLILKLTLGRKL